MGYGCDIGMAGPMARHTRAGHNQRGRRGASLYNFNGDMVRPRMKYGELLKSVELVND